MGQVPLAATIRVVDFKARLAWRVATHPGVLLKLSDEALRQIAEIDANIRRAALTARDIVMK